MFCTFCGKKLDEPQAVCCENVFIRRKDDAIVVVDQHTADIMVVTVED